MDRDADRAVLRKRSFRLPAGLKVRLLAAATGLGALVLGVVVAAGLLRIADAFVVAALYAGCAFVFARVTHAEIRADDRGIQTAVRQALRPRRIAWQEVAQFDVSECAGGEMIVVARLRDGSDVVLPELRSEYPWAWRWGRDGEAVEAICGELNRRRELEVRMFRYFEPHSAPVPAVAGTRTPIA